MKSFLRSVLTVAGLMALIMLALASIVGNAGKAVRQFAKFIESVEGLILRAANSWQRLKRSDAVQDLSADAARGAEVVFSREAVILWGPLLSAAALFVIVVLAWHRLVTLPRVREKEKVRKRLSGGRASSAKVQAEGIGNDN